MFVISLWIKFNRRIYETLVYIYKIIYNGGSECNTTSITDLDTLFLAAQIFLSETLTSSSEKIVTIFAVVTVVRSLILNRIMASPISQT